MHMQNARIAVLLNAEYSGMKFLQASLQEAVDILESQMGDICLEVQYVAVDDSDEENSLGEDMYGFR
jgi:hypothetical protein